MTNPVGGFRDRLIEMSFTNMLEDALRDLGWFDSDNMLVTKSVEIVDEPIAPNVEVLPNKISVTSEGSESEEAELGSGLENISWDYYIEIFAESESVGKHLAGDIRDILKGKMPSIGRGDSHFQVYDNSATPTPLFTCELEDIASSRTHSFSDSIRQFWWTVGCTVKDSYWNENDL